MRLSIIGLCLVPGFYGCSSTKAVGSDADIKKAFSQKTFSINDVPPEQRERVRAIMNSQKAMKK